MLSSPLHRVLSFVCYRYSVLNDICQAYIYTSNMKSETPIIPLDRPFFEKYMYVLLALVAAIPIFIITQMFVKSAGTHEDEAVSTAITALVIVGIFAGRFIGKLWALRTPRIRKRNLFLLAFLIISLTTWVSFHADFQWSGRPALNLLLFWLPMVVISLSFGMLVKLVRETTHKQLTAARMSAAHSESELYLLQSQLSPHFLFNTLNNLYGISISEHEKVPPLLLKLSELLRYSVYDANAAFVMLKDEINYIENYIAFETIRMGDRLLLKKEFDNSYDKSIMIAPMLLIVFIENAFKHSKNTGDEHVHIEINLKKWENWILFSVQNSCGAEKKEKTVGSKDSGFGLDNVRKRLQLLYPGEHQLDIVRENKTFKVVLQLKARK